MARKEQILATAEAVLAGNEAGLTAEALARQVGSQIGQLLPAPQLVTVLRTLPNRFTEGADGRWHLRRMAVSVPDEMPEALAPMVAPAPALPLRLGCYCVFDLEATSQEARGPATEIIQIAAQCWVDGQPQPIWQTFVRPAVPLPAEIIDLTKITQAEVDSGAPPAEALRALFAYAGDLPLVAHNGVGYDGPLVRSVAAREGVPVPDSFLVLDTLPLARALLPTQAQHTVSSLAEYFGVLRPDAHRADVDIAMLGDIVQGLERLLAADTGGAAVYLLLARAGDPWVALLHPPRTLPTAAQIIAGFGAAMTPLLPDRAPATDGPVTPAAIDALFDRAASADPPRPRRPAQVTLAQLAAETLATGGYAVVEAGTGTGKSLGYLAPAALVARATGQPVVVSTYTKVLQAQLLSKELPFVQTLVPDLQVALLQGRSNYLSLPRLAEELTDALAEPSLPPARAWTLALLVRFAAASAEGNLEEIGTALWALDEGLGGDGAVQRLVGPLRSAPDEPPTGGLPDFYRRARANADVADVVLVNHALLLRNFLNPASDDPLARRVVCDEAHTLEDAATAALEMRVEERTLRRQIRAIYDPITRSGLAVECRRLGLPAGDPRLDAIARAADSALAALDSLAGRLHAYVRGQTVVAPKDLERYGVQVPIAANALQGAGGPALRTAADTLGGALTDLDTALEALLGVAVGLSEAAPAGAAGLRPRRLARSARSLLRDLRAQREAYAWFWSFRDASASVRVVALDRQPATPPGPPGTIRPLAPVSLSGVPINVGPALWARFWSRLDAAVCTSATLTVFGQGFDFFRGRIGLESERAATMGATVRTQELPHALPYHDLALLLMPNDLPAPRDTDLKRAFPEAVAGLLRRFIPFFHGRTLALFTANSRRDFVYQAIRDPLNTAGFPVICQRSGGGLKNQIEEFRKRPETSLLGSRSLWEGVDVPGDSLSFVFLEKLPYPSLGDPVEAARMGAVEAAGGNPFAGYLLPKMILLLKQGFGRLVRDVDDRGVAILLDKRLRNSLYRTEVLRSLPNPTIGYESDTALFRRVAEWMGQDFDPTDLPAPTVPDVARILAENTLPAVIIDPADFAAVALPRLLAVQQAIWGHAAFRPGQDAIIRDVLAGHDVLTLLPTGAGKSRTYQLPALIRPGLTLVISPLIALIRDQVEKLREVPGLTQVASLISGMDAASQEDVLRQAVAGQLRLLYISPERLRDPRFVAVLPRLPLVQLVVDEAHCISTWGHDFRPDFLDIARLLPPGPDGSHLPVHALTATATAAVQAEIQQTLAMGTGARSLAVHQGDFVRPNLIFRVYRTGSRADRDAQAVGIVHQLVRDTERGGAGIVYVATRRTATQLARLFRDRNIAAQAYHGGLPTPERHGIQERFMQGDLEVVVATSAFGMGVDKAEIRFVLHYDHPSSLEAYVQEAGRAGRDGKDAYAILLYHRESQRTQRFLARLGQPSAQALAGYRQALLAVADLPGVTRLPDGGILCDPAALAGTAGVDEALGRVLLYTFEQAGLLARGPDATIEATILPTQPVATILAALSDPAHQMLAAALFGALGATPDCLVTYRAAQHAPVANIDPRQVDRLLVDLAARDLLLYRSYSRGMTLQFAATLADAPLAALAARFAARYDQFERRLQAMLAYIDLRSGGNRCRSAHLVNYLIGATDTPRCGRCDLCSSTETDLPWDATQRLYNAPIAVDLRQAILEAVRDHDGMFGSWTMRKLLLGVPQTPYGSLSPTALHSDHFGALHGIGTDDSTLGAALTALIGEGFLAEVSRTLRNSGQTYEALALTPLGRDALAGGVPLLAPLAEVPA